MQELNLYAIQIHPYSNFKLKNYISHPKSNQLNNSSIIMVTLEQIHCHIFRLALILMENYKT